MHTRANDVGADRIGASMVYGWWLAGCYKTFVCSREDREQDSEEESPRGEQLGKRKLARLL